MSSGHRCDVLVRRATLDEVFALRHAELRPGLPRARAEFDGDASPTTRHFAAFATPLPDAVGCASFMVAPYTGVAPHQLRGMATRADLAHRGIGSALLRYAIADLVAHDHAPLFWCNARVAAIPFYRHMGWQIASDVFDVPTVGPHRVMTFVAATPSRDG